VTEKGEAVKKMILDLLINRDPSVKRHLAKTITWRIIGTIDTMVLSWIITGDAMMGLKIGGVEVITKMILYYFHERIWYRMNFGLTKRKSK
jgi:uncharacterized membrane protein